MTKLTASPAARAAAMRTGKLVMSARQVQPAPKLPEATAATPPPQSAEGGEQLQQHCEVEALLRVCFPEAFRVPRPPLAIGIDKQVLDVAGADIDRKTLTCVLRFWVSRPDYLDAVAHGEPRVNLDGSAAGIPTEEQQRSAACRVYGKRRAPAILARIAARRAAHRGVSRYVRRH